jgi:uncharacterized protein GlcG (DUF336 family)
MPGIKSLNLKQAQVMVDAMVAFSKEKGLNMSVAVVDATDTLVSFAKMDEASPLTARVSINKAHTALDARRDTKDIVEGLKNNQKDPYHYLKWGNPRFSPILGGVLLKTGDGSIVGAIGTSGAVATMDEEVARTGAAAYKE